MHFSACVAKCLWPSISEILWGAASQTPSECISPLVLRTVCCHPIRKSCGERRGQHHRNEFPSLCCEVLVAIDFGNPVGSGVANTIGMHFPYVLRSVGGHRFRKSCGERRGQHLRNAFPRLCYRLLVAIDFGNHVGSGVANTFGMHFSACFTACWWPSISEIVWGAASTAQTARNSMHGTACTARPARHGLHSSTASTARPARHALHGQAWYGQHGTARHNTDSTAQHSTSGMARPARYGQHGTAHTARLSRHGQHGTASTARPARHGWTCTDSTALSARHGQHGTASTARPARHRHHGTTTTVQPARDGLHGTACTARPARNGKHGTDNTERLARHGLHGTACTARPAQQHGQHGTASTARPARTGHHSTASTARPARHGWNGTAPARSFLDPAQSILAPRRKLPRSFLAPAPTARSFLAPARSFMVLRQK